MTKMMMIEITANVLGDSFIRNSLLRNALRPRAHIDARDNIGLHARIRGSILTEMRQSQSRFAVFAREWKSNCISRGIILKQTHNSLISRRWPCVGSYIIAV